MASGTSISRTRPKAMEKGTLEFDKRRTMTDHKQDSKTKVSISSPTKHWSGNLAPSIVLLDLGDETCPKVAENSDTPLTALARRRSGSGIGQSRHHGSLGKDKIQLNGMHRRKK